MKKADMALKILEEMELNYKFQYPKKVPDLDIIVDLIDKEVNTIRCNFCGEVCDGKIILRDQVIQKTDGSDLILCGTCLNLYANQEYDKLEERIK